QSCSRRRPLRPVAAGSVQAERLRRRVPAAARPRFAYPHSVRPMRSLFYSFLGYFLTPPGVVVMAALDSSMVFFLPLGIDFIVVLLAARTPGLFWLYAVLAAIGSTAGAALTFWIGRKVGEVGLSRFIRPSTLRRVERQVGPGAAVSAGALAIVPPPFPYTAFVLASGAFGANVWTFLTTLAGVRLLRFAIEAALAAYYGRGILAWMQSRTFALIVGALVVMALVGTAISAVAVARSTRRGPSTRPT